MTLTQTLPPHLKVNAHWRRLVAYTMTDIRDHK